MIKNYLNRERLEKIKSWRETYGAGSNVMLPAEEAEELARIALAAMDSEPHTDDELSNLLWYSQEATCHSDPNYYCEFQRLATPGLIAGIIRELQERRKAAMDSEPVAYIDKQWTLVYYTPPMSMGLKIGDKLYRHAQQPVVPATLPCSVELKPGLIIGKGCKTETLLTALRRRADYNADIDAMTPEERAEHDASIKTFKAMLAAAPQEVKDVKAN